MRKPNNKTPYKNSPTMVLKIKLERIDDLCDKLAERRLSDNDIAHIRAILRETQSCIENLYNERVKEGV